MENLPLDEFIRYKSVTKLSVLLRKWININYHMAASWQWKDCPWWYNERASVSAFTAAVWKAGGLALEEFCDEKIYRRSRYAGRCDLYFEFGGKNYTAEAKHIWLAAGPRANATISHITNALVKASNDVQHIKRLETKTKANVKLSIVFAIPYFPESSKDKIGQLLKRFQTQLCKHPCYNMAWVFPKKARELHWQGYFYPGAVIILRKV